MKTKPIVFLLLLFSITVSAQKNVTLSGYVKDEANGEALIGATVYIKELSVGVVSNLYGFYSLQVAPGTYEVHISYIGYETISQEIDLAASKQLSVDLVASSQVLEEVVVTGEAADANVERIEMSMEKLPVKMVKKLPAFMGEVDVIKTIQLLPGIQSGGEGNSGLYVRGGGPDENLLLLDEAPVYNASHLMGFFSVFNSDAIKDIQVYKGGIPAMYGGKASSVIDIRQKDGNLKEHHVTAGIGNISSRLTVEGPIIKDKASFIVSGRRTYADVLGKLIGIEELKDNQLYFYDLNGKANYIINDNNRIYLSAYKGDDYFSLGESIYMRWGNTTFTGRWNHIFSPQLFTNTSFIYSRYNYNLGVPGENADNFDWSSMIRDWNFKMDFSYYINPNNQMKFGVNAFYHHFEPGKIESTGSSFYNDIELTHYNALEGALYASNEQKVGNKLSVLYGLRLTMFQQVGEGAVRYYDDPENPDKDEITGSEEFDAFEPIGNALIHLEPRLALKYRVGRTSSIKASYNRMVQNLHLISNTSSPTPLDIWLPSSTYIDPLIVDQVAIGYFRNFKNDAIETSVEVYYKTMDNVLDYKDGAELFLNENLETELLHGTGYSMGLEVLVKKQQGDFTGWIGYTLARTMRDIEGISNKEYPSSYDRTHDLSLVTSYQLNKYWNIAANLVYATGNPTSYPVAKYTVQGNTIFDYASRNSHRIPDYHRLDLSVTFDFRKNDRRRFKQSLNLSLYNVYARRNAYSVTFKANEDNPSISEPTRLSIIGTIIPSITYNVSF